MSTTHQIVSGQIYGVAKAANADELGERTESADVTATASGWDAYEVWRRFIKEARDRRAAADRKDSAK